MPDSIDNRVVEMEFKNQEFQKNAQDTVSMLDKLREKLSFKGAAKGFQDLDTAAKNIHLDSISSAVEQLSGKFTSMSAVAFTAIQRVVNTAITGGVQIAQSLTLKPLMDGFSEYETNLNSIQTILANTKSQGSTLDDVNAALAQLNTYSDKTIYNFSQMARNIGTFTAAGIDLDTSVNAIKGISNLAAISGSNAEQASTAMYQMSQALATGSVKLMDWNSIVNAGMGGEVFKNALLQTGEALGTITDVPVGTTLEDWEKAGNNFRDSLQDGWITSDVLTTTLQAFTGDLSDAQLQQLGYTREQAEAMAELGRTGVAAATEVKTITQLVGTVKEAIGTGWSDSMRIVIGDFEEAKTLWTTVNNIVGAAIGRNADARNALLQGWRDLGGREALIQGLGVVFHHLVEFMHEIGDAWKEVFPPVTAQTLFDLTVRFTEFLDSLIPTGKTLNQLGLIFQGVFSVLSIGWEVVKNIFDLFKSLFDEFGGDPGGDLLNFLALWGIRLERLEERLVNAQQITRWFNDVHLAIRNFIHNVQDSTWLANFQEAIDRIKDALHSLKDAITGFFNDSTGATGEDENLGIWDRLANVISFVGDGIAWLADKIADAAEKVTDFFGNIIDGLSNVDVNSDTLTDIFNVGILATIAVGIRSFLRKIQEFSPQSFLDKITGAVRELTNTLEAMQTKLKSEALLNIAIAIGVLAASLFVLSTIDAGDLTKALTATAAGFAQLAATMVALNRMDMSARGAAKMATIGTTMILIAGALLVLSIAVKILSTMDPAQLAAGMTAITTMLTELVVAIKHLPDQGTMIRTGIAMIAIAAALVVMALAVKLFGMMDTKELIQGLIGVGVALGILVGAIKHLPSHSLIKTGIGIIAIAVALVILAGAVKLMSMMDWGEMLQGLLGIGILLAGLVLAIKALPSDMARIGGELVLIAIGLAILVGAVAVLGSMPLQSLIQGLIGLAAILLILAAASDAMEGALPGATAIVVMSGAILVLAIALAAIAAIGIKGLIVAIIAIAAVLVIFAVAANLLAESIPAMLALASAMIIFGAALALIGAAVFLAGAGIWMLVKAIGALVDLVVDTSDGVIEVLDLLIDKILELAKGFFDLMLAEITEFIDQLPDILRGLGEAFIVLVDEIRESLPHVFELIDEFIVELLDLLNSKVPDFIATGIELFFALLQGIDESIEAITDKVIDIILKFTETLTARMPEIVDAGVDLLVSFLSGLTDNVDKIIDAVETLITTIIDGLIASHERLIESGKDLIRQLIIGMSELVTEVIQAGADFIVNVLTGLGNAVQGIINAGVWVITTLLDGIEQSIDTVTEKGKDITLAILKGLADKSIDFLNSAADLLVNFLNALEEAIRTHFSEIRSAALGVVDALWDGITGGLSDKLLHSGQDLIDIGQGILDKITHPWEINSPSKAMIRNAGSLMEGVMIGVTRNERATSNALANTGDNLMKAFNNAIAGLGQDLQMMDEFNPTITPVLDLTQVNSGAKDIASLISSGKITADASFTHAAVIATAEANKASITQESPGGPTEIKFEQTINSPKELTTGEIHRDTKSLLVLAKKELDI